MAQKYKQAMYDELENQGLHPGWVGNSIRIDQTLMVRFYPDCETYELMRWFNKRGWKSMAITTDTYTISLMAKAQLKLSKMASGTI